ncbi:MAG: aminoacyl-tRNA hydrolase [Pseudomonadota bacterium]
MLLIAGLGNPGGDRANNRHNIGFMAADEIARRHDFSSWRKKFKSQIAEGELAGEKILLMKPQTYMNLSGEAVGEAMRFYKLSPSNVIVLYDELDLPAGKLRVKTGGGAGGHNGIRSVESHCGNAFHRIRLGIGHPGNKAMVQRHVLGDFAKADHDWLEPFLDATAEYMPLVAKGEYSTYMNRVSLATSKNEPDKKAKKPQKAKSHIHQARAAASPKKMPEDGPMAAMLKKLFSKE